MIESEGKTMLEYRNYIIRHDPPPIPMRDHDYNFAHEDYEGPGDRRCGTGENVKDCKRQIDELIMESLDL